MSLFFIKKETEYEMRISDWSSYVCSSDLRRGLLQRLSGLSDFADRRSHLAQREFQRQDLGPGTRDGVAALAQLPARCDARPARHADRQGRQIDRRDGPDPGQSRLDAAAAVASGSLQLHRAHGPRRTDTGL